LNKPPDTYTASQSPTYI